MRTKRANSTILVGVFLFLAFLVSGRADSPSKLRSLLPEPSGWTLTEAPPTYLPGTLFEYIDGAAENYLSYGFRELVVGNYKEAKSGATLTVEIYDMEDEIRAFGIYSSERYPESRFIEIGNQGYWEDGALNFIIGGYYIKLLCFDCGEGNEQVLTSIAREVEKKVSVKGTLPPLLDLFPREGLIAKSEKFILQNVQGHSFLHHGYVASYRAHDQEFELLIIQGTDAQDAQNMMTEFLDSHRARGQTPQTVSLGFHVRDRYSDNIYLARSGNLLLGVIKIKDGFEEVGLEFLGLLVQAAKT